MHTELSWNRHPGRNPEHRFGKGRDRWKEKMPLPGRPFNEVIVLGPKNPSRWLPHQSKRERSRRAA